MYGNQWEMAGRELKYSPDISLSEDKCLPARTECDDGGSGQWKVGWV
jgi:hypothetical protein